MEYTFHVQIHYFLKQILSIIRKRCTVGHPRIIYEDVDPPILLVDLCE